MIYITGDTHGDFSRFKDSTTRKIKKGDTLIVCGDFGFIWNGDKTEKQILKKIGELKYTVAFIDGCHENFKLLSEYPEIQWNGGTARAIGGKLVHLKRGQVYTIEGKKFFTFGGGHSQDIDIRRETNTWFEEEQPTIEEVEEGVKNLLAHPSLPLAKNFFKDQAKKLRNLLDFFLEICYNIFVGILVLVGRGVAKCLLSVIKIME